MIECMFSFQFFFLLFWLYKGDISAKGVLSAINIRLMSVKREVFNLKFVKKEQQWSKLREKDKYSKEGEQAEDGGGGV